MRSLLSFAAAALTVLSGGSAAKAQYFHGHAHYHRGHVHYHGHWHYPSYYNNPYGGGYPPVYGSTLSYPTYYYPSVVQAAPVIVPVGGVNSTALRPNALPPYAGPGVTLRLPPEYPGPVYVRIDNRDIELKPGTEVTLRDKAAYVVEFDRGGDYGATRYELAEGSYKMTVGTKGWQVLPDTGPAGGLRPNTLPGEPKK